MNALLRGQIEGSDAVLVNKTDLVDDETIAKVERISWIWSRRRSCLIYRRWPTFRTRSGKK